MMKPTPAHRRASPTPPRPPTTTPSPRLDSSSSSTVQQRPLTDINNRSSVGGGDAVTNSNNSVDGSRCSSSSAASPVYLKYTKQQQKQQGMFTIQHEFSSAAKENKPAAAAATSTATTRGLLGSGTTSFLSNSFTHEFPYAETSEDDETDHDDSASETSSTCTDGGDGHKKALVQTAKTHSLLQDFYNASDDAHSEDSTLKDSLNSSSCSMLYDPRDVDSPTTSISSTTSGLGQEGLSMAKTANTTMESKASLSEGRGKQALSPNSSLYSSSDVNGSIGETLDLKYSISKDTTASGASPIDYLQYCTDLSEEPTSRTNHTPDLKGDIPEDEPTPVFRNTASSRIPSPTTSAEEDGNTTLKSTSDDHPIMNEKKTVIEWATPRPSNDIDNGSTSMSLPSMLGGGSAFDVSDLESPSLLAQTTMTSYGSSDIHSQSIVENSSDLMMMTTGSIDHNISNKNGSVYTPSAAMMMSSNGGVGRPPRSTSMNGLTTPELWSHAQNSSSDIDCNDITTHAANNNRGLQSAPASLAMNQKPMFFRSGIPTPSPRNGDGGETSEKEQSSSDTTAAATGDQERLKTPVTLGSLLVDTLELQSDETEQVLLNGITTDNVDEDIKGPGSTASSEELSSHDSDEDDENRNNKSIDDMSMDWTDVVPPPSEINDDDKCDDDDDDDDGSSCQIQNLDSLDEIRKRFRRACCIRAVIAIIILIAGIIALSLTLIPIVKDGTSEDENAKQPVNDLPTEVPSSPPSIGAKLTGSPVPVPNSAPTPTPTMMPIDYTLTAAPVQTPPASTPTLAPVTLSPVNNRPTTSGGSPVAQPSVTFPPVHIRPTTPGGSPVARPSVSPPEPSGPPAWAAVLQGEQFWTDLEVHIELAWPKSSSNNQLDIEILSTLDGVYDEYLQTSIDDWNSPTYMNISLTYTSPSDEFCQPEMGKIKICNADYGHEEWRGYGKLFLSGRYVGAATIQINDHPALDPYLIQYELCHLLGHSFGLYHVDSGGCMVEKDVVDDSDGSYLRPNTESLEYLEELYGSNRQLRKRQLQVKNSRQQQHKEDVQMKSDEGQYEVHTFYL